MPWTLPFRPSRRSLLAGAAGAAGAALLTGCSGGPSPEEEARIPLERRMREAAVRESERLLE
ncbi:twin-arginine translocation signal domain-containing protein, partial [Streptomyces sp. NPDC059233]